jgi:iron(III) transport system substrate-binding protein
MVASMVLTVLFLISCTPRSPESVVIAYCAQDQFFAEPIFAEFTKQTGIKVRALYDSEAVKTVGLANRLLAERAHPQCDVFWGNEEFRTRQLEAAGVFDEQQGWKEFGYRSRRMVINTNFVRSPEPTPGPSQEGNGLSRRRPSGEDVVKGVARASTRDDATRADDPSPPRRGQGWVPPRSLGELTNATWRGKVALAYPLFGTTATHFLALRQHWGETRWETWCRALAANKPFLVDGNSMVVKLVARGEAWIGLTDSDDIAAAQREGLPVAALPMTEESLLIPNTAGVIRNAPHPEAARKLVEFLQARAVVDRLIAANALEGFCACDVNEQTLQPKWERVLAELEPATAKLKEIFLR